MPKPWSCANRALLAAMTGLVFYGGWGFYANHIHGHYLATKAALAQGFYSFLITLTLSTGMDYFYRKCPWPGRRLVFTLTITCTLLYTTSWGVHTAFGTPETLATLLPGALVGTVYSAVYCVMLDRQPTKMLSTN